MFSANIFWGHFRLTLTSTSHSHLFKRGPSASTKLTPGTRICWRRSPQEDWLKKNQREKWRQEIDFRPNLLKDYSLHLYTAVFLCSIIEESKTNKTYAQPDIRTCFYTLSLVLVSNPINRWAGNHWHARARELQGGKWIFVPRFAHKRPGTSSRLTNALGPGFIGPGTSLEGLDSD